MEQLYQYLFDFRVSSIFFGILIPFLLYRYSTRNFDYWKKRGIPYAKPYPLIGSFGATLKKSFEDVELDRYKKLGKIYGLFEGNKPVLTVAEPEIIRDILVKDFQYFSTRRDFSSDDPILGKMLSLLKGEDWKRVRNIVTPTFSTGKIKIMLSIFKECSRTVLQSFNITAAKGEPVEIVKLYGAFSMDIIASSAFSTKIDSHNNPENQFVKMARLVFDQKPNLGLLLFVTMPSLVKIFKIKVFCMEAVEFFKTVTLQIIEERKKTGQTRNDFLQLLLDTANEVEKEEKSEEKPEDITANYVDGATNHSVFKSNTSSKHLSMNELIAQCVVFFFAGYHTTATTISLATYLLTINQDVQEKLYKEIKDILKETSGELTYESLQNMKYLDNIISETLRLYSPLLRVERTAEADYNMGKTGLTIPKGMLVGIPVFAMQRDPILFPDPEKFNPDRFSPQKKESLVTYSFLPFGAGPRNCVGMRFALMEIKVCLVYVFSTYHVKRCSETKVPLEFRKGQGVLAPADIMVRMEARSDSPLKK